MKHLTRILTCAAALLVAAHASMAADEPPPAGSADTLAGARSQIAAGRFREALTELRRVNDPGSADWHNLMGLTLRKQPRPDLLAAEGQYEAALRIDPRHRGALEYSGELKLQQGDLPGARARLATLAAVCARSCDEYRTLKQAIALYQSDGRPPSGW